MVVEIITSLYPSLARNFELLPRPRPRSRGLTLNRKPSSSSVIVHRKAAGERIRGSKNLCRKLSWPPLRQTFRENGVHEYVHLCRYIRLGGASRPGSRSLCIPAVGRPVRLAPPRRSFPVEAQPLGGAGRRVCESTTSHLVATLSRLPLVQLLN